MTARHVGYTEVEAAAGELGDGVARAVTAGDGDIDALARRRYPSANRRSTWRSPEGIQSV